MQGRMKQHQLTEKEMNDVLRNAQVGRIATYNENGYPYVVPVHFVVYEEKVYIHGLIKGQKISNLLKNDKVGFEVDEMGAIVPNYENSCGTNTKYRSVIILGTARMVEEADRKEEILHAIVIKYTPQLSHLNFPEKMMQSTSIIEITPVETTGKYHK